MLQSIPTYQEHRRVLVVDDNREIADVTAQRLSAAGYKTLIAYDGGGALEMSSSEQPNAVLIDVQMSPMDGIETVRRLRMQDETRRIPVVMMSASSRYRSAALQIGARFFIAKPYNSQHLLATIDAAIRESDPIV